MSLRVGLCVLVCAVTLAAGSPAGQSPSAPSRRYGYDVECIGAPLPDPVMQQAKETYVVFGCACCHGVTLTRSRRGSGSHAFSAGRRRHATVTDRRAPSSRDTACGQAVADAAVLGPERSSAARHCPLASTTLGSRDDTGGSSRRRPRPATRAAGGSCFAQNCSSCHAADLNGIGKKYDAATIRDRLLRPASLEAAQAFTLDALNDTRKTTARQRHNFPAGELHAGGGRQPDRLPSEQVVCARRTVTRDIEEGSHRMKLPSFSGFRCFVILSLEVSSQPNSHQLTAVS